MSEFDIHDYSTSGSRGTCLPPPFKFPVDTCCKPYYIHLTDNKTGDLKMSDFDILVGKTIEKIIHNSDCVAHESVDVFFTDGTSYRIQSSGGEIWKGEGWSEINLTNVT